MKFEPWPLDQPIPKVCTIEDVCRLMQWSRRTFQRHDAARELPLVECARVGRGRRFTGASVRVLAGSQWAKSA